MKNYVYDATHGTNQYNFNLTTIVVIDEFGEGYPAAFCISSKIDEVHMTVFFLKIDGSLTTKAYVYKTLRVLLEESDIT